MLIYFIRRRRDMPFPIMFWLFGAFIISCGFTHFLEAITFYSPMYRLTGLVKILTAAASWATVIALVPVTPLALAMRSAEELEREIADRKAAQVALESLQDDLENRVRERTAALECANKSLQDEIRERQRAEQGQRAAQQQLLELKAHEKELVEVELAKAQGELIRNTRLATLGKLAASIAHDLRNPLGAIRNAAYYLKRKVPDDQPKWTEYLGIIQEEVGTSDRIISNLLEITRGKQPVKEQVNLDDLIQEVFDRAQGLESQYQFAADARPFLIHADPVQLRQIFTNLINNALEAKPQAAFIAVNASQQAGFSVITIRDNGPGIAEEHRHSLFEPLFTTKSKGTGLGLWLCRQIVERHGGHIQLVDDGLAGTAFAVSLPLISTKAGP